MTHSTTPKHFLSLTDLSTDELIKLIKRGLILKQEQNHDSGYAPLQDKTLIMIFEKSSTRTRVSFEVAMHQLGGYAIFLSSNDSQLGRGESAEDSARVLANMADIIMLRTFQHQRLVDFASYSNKPVINGLTDHMHPCQVLADMLTFYEKKGDIAGKSVAWIGDGNNMCHSYIEAAKMLGFHLRIACPKEFYPDEEVLSFAGHYAEIVASPEAAVAGVDLIATDVWTSMGQEKETTQRLEKFSGYQVDKNLMAQADKDAIFMHCLPAHRGEEVSAEVLESEQSVVWDEAENRLHVQKALLELLVQKNNL